MGVRDGWGGDGGGRGRDGGGRGSGSVGRGSGGCCLGGDGRGRGRGGGVSHLLYYIGVVILFSLKLYIFTL